MHRSQAISPLRQRMLDDMRMRKLGAEDADRLRPRRAQACRASSGVRRTPPRPRTCAVTSCTWSTTAPRRSRSTPTLTGLKFFFDVTLGRGELMAKMQPVRVPQHAAGGAQPRGGRPADRGGRQPQAPDGAVGGLRRRSARQRGHRAEGRRHRQPAHDAARRTGQGRKDRYAMLSPVLLERLRAWWRVAHAQGKIFHGGWLFPGLDPIGSVDRPATQPRHPCRRRRRRHRQARLDAFAAPCLCHPPAGAEGRHPS